MRKCISCIILIILIGCKSKPATETVLIELRSDSLFDKYVSITAMEIAIMQRGLISNTFINLKDRKKQKEYLMSLVKDYDDTAQMHSWYNKLFYKYVRDEGLKNKDFNAAIQQSIMQKEQILFRSNIFHRSQKVNTQ